ncbi:response regulator transcription factor [Paenibacillus sp. MMS18-CY102]|uniref:response regulator transcription factor n=1 Tax=Paenibacillus sp. MMS18-CY102 TaxID=2682849 RepID=UPI0013662E0A|nr:response regulator [Paenibacillus sp. MMS18-CY102]MWC27876.1 response regulator [Paenibacillus sp. MMS18-CY102]
MFKAMLVDDDVPVLNYLAKRVNWSDLGLDLTGTYEKSKEALEAGLASMPDIMITDIGMPEMNGLELVKALKAKAPNLKVIVISCHNEFEYAKQALQLGVKDYLLKETLSAGALSEMLEALVQELQSQRTMEQENERLKRFEGRHRSVIKERLLRELLYQPIWDYRAWAQQCGQQGLHFIQEPVIPVLCRVDRCEETIRQLRLDDETYKFAFDNIASEYLREQGVGMFMPLDSHRAFLFFPAAASIHVNAFDKVKEQLAGVQSAVKRHLKSSTSYFIGGKQPLAQLRSGAAEMLLHLDRHFYEKEGSIGPISREPFAEDDVFQHYAEAEQELKRSLVQDNIEELQEVVAKWLAFIASKKYPPALVKEWVLKLVLDLQMKLRSLKHFMSSYSDEVVHSKVLRMETIFHLEEWLLVYIERLTAPMDLGHVQDSIIVKAQNYVEQHMNEKISTEMAAAYLHLNPSYFSRIYKQGTKEGFIKYVTRMKMQEACKLLDATNLTIEDISSRLGYEHKSYFNKCFKTVMCVSPVEYRGQK